MNIYSALDAIVQNRDNKALNYAVHYAIVARTMNKGTEAFHTQLVYVLSNITSWRGSLAKEVRQSIKKELNRV